MLGGILGTLGRIGGSQIGRAAGGWALQKLGGLVGGMARHGLSRMMSSPIGTALKFAGPIVASAIGEDSFNKSMRKFGDTI